MSETARYLAWDEIAPEVDHASYWEFPNGVWHTYRLPGHHLLLPTLGRIDAVTTAGRLSADVGDLICFRPAARNEYGSRKQLSYYQIHLYFAPAPRHVLTPWLGEAGALPATVALGARQARARELFEAVVLVLDRADVASRLRVRAAINELLALIAEATLGAQTRSIEPLDAWQRARLRLEGDLGRTVRVADLARDQRLSADHFIRAFRSRFGVSPQRMRTHARMRAAARRLRTGDEPVKAVARAVGIADATAFARLFRRYFGITPTELRAGATAAIIADPAYNGVIPNRHVVPPETAPDWEKRFYPDR